VVEHCADLIREKSDWEVFLREVSLLLSAVTDMDGSQPYYWGTSYELVCWWPRQ